MEIRKDVARMANAAYRILHKFIVKDIELPVEPPVNEEDGIIIELDQDELTNLNQPILECFNTLPWRADLSNNPTALVVVYGAPDDIIEISITFAHTELKKYTVDFPSEPTAVICHEHLGLIVEPKMWLYNEYGWEAPGYGTGNFYSYISSGYERNAVGKKIDVLMATSSENSMWHLGTGYPNANTQLAGGYYFYDSERDVVSIREQKNSTAKKIYKFSKKIKISGVGGYEEFREREEIGENKYILAVEISSLGSIIAPRTAPDTNFGTLKDTVLWIYDVTANINGIEVEKYKSAVNPNLLFIDGNINIKPSGNISPGIFEVGKRSVGSMLISNAYKYAPWVRYPNL